MGRIMTKTGKKAKVKKPRKSVVIESEVEFRQSLKLGSNKAGIQFDNYSSIIKGTSFCSCGVSYITVQGARGGFFACKGCGVWYALSNYIEMVKMTKAQKDFVRSRYSVDIN